MLIFAINLFYDIRFHTYTPYDGGILLCAILSPTGAETLVLITLSSLFITLDGAVVIGTSLFCVKKSPAVASPISTAPSSNAYSYGVFVNVTGASAAAP